ncbi:MAG: thioredoxin family protein [Planctomycetota bacterium]
MNFFTVMIVGLVVGVGGKEPTDYKSAYLKAQTGDKPLLVLVTADWCAPCRAMKTTTIPELMKKDAFRDFHYATVDLGKEQELARKLIGDRGVPQLIVFQKSEMRWERRYLRGIQSVETVEAFITEGKTSRLAKAIGSLNK